MNYYIYTGNNENEALLKANTAITMINKKTQEICQSNWVNDAQKLTANPTIEGNIYYYGFESPPEIFRNNAVYDLETEYKSDWFIQEKI